LGHRCAAELRAARAQAAVPGRGRAQRGCEERGAGAEQRGAAGRDEVGDRDTDRAGRVEEDKGEPGGEEDGGAGEQRSLAHLLHVSADRHVLLALLRTRLARVARTAAASLALVSARRPGKPPRGATMSLERPQIEKPEGDIP